MEALGAMNNFGQELTSSIRLREDELLLMIFEQAQKLIGARNIYIALYIVDTGELRFPLATEKGQTVEYPSRIANMDKRGKTEDIIFTRFPILHQTKEEAEAWYTQPGHQEFVGVVNPSWLGVPMMVGENRVLGVIAIYDLEREHAYNELDLQVLSSMASQAAIALDNVRLYEKARGEVVAAKQLSTLGTAIAALQHRINNTFNIIIPNVDRLRKRVDLSDPTIVEILDIIERNARYTSKIISRIQEPLKEVEVSFININTIIDDVLLEKRELWKASVTAPICNCRV